jgi:hypothetical protein
MYQQFEFPESLKTEIIIHSANFSKKDIEEYSKFGIKRVLPKPSPFSEIKKIILQT